HKSPRSMLVTHHLLWETPPAPGLTLKLQSLCEPGGGTASRRRRERRSMVRGTLASLLLRLSDKRRPTRPFAARPERADEGGGARRRAARKGGDRACTAKIPSVPVPIGSAICKKIEKFVAACTRFGRRTRIWR